MAHTRTYIRKNNVVITTLRGKVDGQEVMELFARLLTTTQTGSIPNHLWDCRYIDALEIDWLSLRGIAHLADTYASSKMAAQVRFAVVANQDFVSENATSMLAFTRKRKTDNMIFNQLQEALAWLNIQRTPAFVIN